MYAYKIGYTDEGGCDVSEIVFHPRLLSEREFKTMCAEAFARGGRDEMDKWISQWQAKSITHYMTTVDSMFEPAMKRLVVDFGFDRPKPCQTFELPGLASIVDGDHWIESGVNENLDLVRKSSENYNLHEIPITSDDMDDDYSIGAD